MVLILLKYIILNFLPFGVKYHLEIHTYTVRACGFLLILPCMENISYEEILKYPIQGYYATKQITGQKCDSDF